jgi:hypothetical protein
VSGRDEETYGCVRSGCVNGTSAAPEATQDGLCTTRSDRRCVPCASDGVLLYTPAPLLSPTPQGPWRAVALGCPGGDAGCKWSPRGCENCASLPNGPNAEPFFLPNGTLFFIGGAGCWLDGNTCVGIQRAENLSEALKGNVTEWAGPRTAPPRLGGAGPGVASMPPSSFHWCAHCHCHFIAGDAAAAAAAATAAAATAASTRRCTSI